MLLSALVGGIFIGVLSALPIVNIANCCCLWIVSGGVLSAYLEQHASGRPVSAGRGAMLGLLAGVTGAVVWLMAFAAFDVVVGPVERRMVAAMLDRSVDVPPDVRAMLETIGERASSPLRYLFGFVFQLFAGMVFSTLGGLMGAILLRRDVPPDERGRDTVPIPE